MTHRVPHLGLGAMTRLHLMTQHAKEDHPDEMTILLLAHFPTMTPGEPRLHGRGGRGGRALVGVIN